ncbi:hypothetical protein ACLUU9_02270 [Rothia mucilaginosa]|uniref:hypothetical protein n=1 Tax=Rothia TaxID=32207 RepID=UPI0025CDFB96|nr:MULTISPECIES: hypothetical protein [Rothia]MBS5102378.1 hypothetical protein [Rothia mucilaginosa]
MLPWEIRKKYPNTWKQEYRFAIILGITLIVFYSCLQFFLHDDSHGSYSICTIESAYTKKRGGMLGDMNDVALIGVFETKECGNIKMYAAPYGKNIPECVSEIQPGKKYKIHKTLSTRNDDKDFDMTRFEEIKE